MKTVVILASLFAMTWAVSVPYHEHVYTYEPVDPVFALQNKKILEFFRYFKQVDNTADYYEIGKDYDIAANIDNYTDKQAVEEFLFIYKQGVLRRDHAFSVTKERMAKEAVALFRVFYYAKDFDTFYKTAAFARIYFNELQFAYSFYIAVLQRADTKNFILPAPYEVFPYLYVNSDVISKMYRWKMANSSSAFEDKYFYDHSIRKDENKFIFYANYSDVYSYSHGEGRLAYFMEDIGWNSYYYFLNLYNPFWMKGSRFGAFKEYRGDIYYYEFQRMMARYKLERQSQGLSEIPTFSWYKPIKYGYKPYLYAQYPFLQRQDYYEIPETYEKELQFVTAFEQTFIQFLEEGHFKAYGQEIDFHNSGALNFVGNYWFTNVDLYEKAGPRNFIRNYELVARKLLSGTPTEKSMYGFWPSALSSYQTTLRDPVAYQFYERVLNYFYEYKKYLEPYTQENLQFVGVKINDVKFTELKTSFEYFDSDAGNAIVYTQSEMEHDYWNNYKIRQPRLTHKNFKVTVDVKSEITGPAMVKIFLGPKYDSEGFLLSPEYKWMDFIELDKFTFNLTQGINSIVRESEMFANYQEDYITFPKLYQALGEGKVPTKMYSKSFDYMPRRLMLPKGHKGGFPVQFFVVVYQYTPASGEFANYSSLLLDKKPFGYPFDRPVKAQYFKLPNMFIKNEFIYHEGEEFTYTYNTPKYVYPANTVPKQ